MYKEKGSGGIKRKREKKRYFYNDNIGQRPSDFKDEKEGERKEEVEE